MSVRVMSWVWENSRAEPMDRLVLLAIADCANDTGAEAYPSMATLVKKTGLHERSIQRGLKRLVDLGELVVYPNAGPKACNRYRVKMTPGTPSPPAERRGGTETPRQDATPADSRSTPGTQPPYPRHTATPTPGTQPPEPSLNHQRTVKEPSVTSSATKNERGTRIPDDFWPTREMIEWARANTPLVGTKDTAAFLDHWRGQPGARGRKTDWVATWRNWMRRAQSDAEVRQQRANGRASPTVEHNGMRLKPETAQRLQDRARFEAMDAQQLAIEGPT